MFKMLKNQKGMTLVELLAVMVIVGIIAAISIPAIGGLMENTRKDAYISNATALQEAARLYVTSNETVIEKNGSFPVTITASGAPSDWEVKTADDTELTATLAESFGTYLESLLDPHTKDNFEIATVVVTKEDNGAYTYETQLVGEKYTTGVATDARELTRANVGAK